VFGRRATLLKAGYVQSRSVLSIITRFAFAIKYSLFVPFSTPFFTFRYLSLPSDVSIPHNSVSYLAPVTTPKLWADVRAYGDEAKHMETA
jgi:hypothetical protein